MCIYIYLYTCHIYIDMSYHDTKEIIYTSTLSPKRFAQRTAAAAAARLLQQRSAQDHQGGQEDLAYGCS